MIAKVQVYVDREDDPGHQVPDYEVKKIINLKFKKAFAKGSLSKFIAAGGSQDRYDANVFYGLFEKSTTTQTTIIALPAQAQIIFFRYLTTIAALIMVATAIFNLAII